MQPEPETATGPQRAFVQICALLDPFGTNENSPPLSISAAEAQRIHEFACFHGIRPALFKALSLSTGLSPPLENLRAKLAEFQMLHRLRVMQTTGEIVELAKGFEAAGIAALFFKGAVLGEQIYGGAQFREFNDIDVLVEPTNRDRAITLVQALKLEPVISDAFMRRSFFDYLGQHSFRSTETDAVVDLHWAFVGTGPFPVSTGQALSSCTEIRLGGAAIPVPSRDTQALILAGHGHKEHWASFGWIVDFATFAATNPDLAWDRIARQAIDQHCLEPLLSAILLVKRVFGQTIHTELAQLGARRPHLVRNVDEIVSRSQNLVQRQYAEELMGGFRLCETELQKFKMVLSLLLTPTIGDFEAMPLRQKLWWIYRITRPLRLLWRRVGLSEGSVRANAPTGGIGA